MQRNLLFLAKKVVVEGTSHDHKRENPELLLLTVWEIPNYFALLATFEF